MPRDRSELKAQATALVEEGVPKREVCRRLGLHRTTLARWVNPELNARHSARAANVKPCPQCGEGMARHARACRRCSRQPHAIREEIKRRALLGHDNFTIALAVGLSPEQVNWRIKYMRDIGDL